jgi:hypothetical protein
MRSFEDLDARNGMNRAPRSSRDLTARSFENQLMGLKEKIQDNLSMMQKKYKELQSSKANKTMHPSFVEIRVSENGHEEGEPNSLGKIKIERPEHLWNENSNRRRFNLLINSVNKSQSLYNE